MVPSRSRKTAGRRELASARSHLRSGKPGARGSLDGLRHHAGHTAMVDGAPAQEAGTAIGFLLNQSAARSERRRAVRIRGSKNCHNRETDCRGDMHGAGVVADKELAAGEERGKISNRGLANQADRWTLYSGSNGV